MIRKVFGSGAAPLVIIALASCGDGASAHQDNEHILSRIPYVFPVPNDDRDMHRPELGPDKVINIADDATLTYGEKTFEDIPAILAALETGNVIPINIRIAPDATFGDIARVMAGFEGDEFEILDTEAHRQFGTIPNRLSRADIERMGVEPREGSADRRFGTAPNQEAGGELTFRGPSDDHLPVVVGYSVKSNACLVSVGGRQVDSEGLFDDSFDRLDRLVERAGGVEAILSQTSVFENLKARIQSTPDTPWRCIAGAMFNIQMSGWPYASLEVVKPLDDPDG